MRVLVTGTDGYVGAVVPTALVARGHEVVGVDTGFHRAGWLYADGSPVMPKTLAKDIRYLEQEDLAGINAVVHMAELSNDPVGQLNAEMTFEINHRGSVRLAELCKHVGIERFVYTSSCSVYGVATEHTVNETSPVNPQTAYAECKVLVERDVGAMADDSFSPTFLRNATAYGASPRMRFDVVVNNLAGLAHTIGEIRIASDGTPWRPLVHIRDIATAIVCTLEAERDAIHGEILNVGSSSANYQVRDIAEIVARTFTRCNVTYATGGGPDNRSYRVSFEKIAKQLPEFRCAWDVERGVRELRSVFERIDLTSADFNWRGFTRLKQIEYLLRTQQIDDEFFWIN